MKNIQEIISQLPYSLIYLGYRGSHAHGTYVPNTDPNSIDDIDLFGCFIGIKEHYLGFGRRDNYEQFIDDYDIVTYEIRKLLGLLLKSNPNVLHTLWLDKKYYIISSFWWDEIVKHRNFFISKQAFHSFSGYARSQLKRMTHFKFEGYMGQKRKQLVEKYGYDTKNASHLIRLLRSGIEFLTTGELTVTRPDAEELIDIKQGKWKLVDIQRMAEELFAEAELAFQHSQLPELPDRDSAEQLLIDIVEDYHIRGTTRHRTF